MIWKIELGGRGKEEAVAGWGRIREAGGERNRVLEAKDGQGAHMVDHKEGQ